eukprot:8026392-Pyramimonas_sp.AAC.1
MQVSRKDADHGMLGPSEPSLEGDHLVVEPHRHSISTLHRPTEVSASCGRQEGVRRGSGGEVNTYEACYNT